MPIRVLTPDVSAKIAAGEVVERPASVVKELLENSLDADATDIAIEVRGGGVDSIRVVDNGVGIPPDQVELAFQRHATSKITTPHDLDAISTLGFRGEALPSIAAVASVSLLTRPPANEAGTLVEVRDGRVVRVETQGCPPGTAVTVRHLFRNIPARRKFLRSSASETSRIHTLVTHYALAYPEIRLSLTVDGSVAFSHGGSGDPREALAAVYGADTAQAMLEVAQGHEPAAGDGPLVWGLASPPSITRANRSYMTLFVNRRWVQSRLLGYALEQAYQGFLMEHRYPLAVLNIKIQYQDVDVNVHPAKTEVRFRWDSQVFAALQQAVRQTLVAFSPVPEIRRVHVPEAVPPAQRWRTDFWSQPARGGPSPSSQPLVFEDAPPIPKTTLPILRVLGQVQNTYVVAEGPDGVYLIDQHAAHERILFERLHDQARRGASDVQSLLEPVPLEVNPQQEELLQSQGELLHRFGFQLEAFGPRTYLLRGVPSLLARGDPQQAFLQVMDLLAEGGGFSQWEDRMAYSLACHGAVRAGMTLSHQEMSELARQLEACRQPHTCPHGRPTMIHLSSSHLEREFGRR